MAIKSYLATPLVALLLLSAAFTGSARADETATRQFPLSGFTRVALKGSSELEVVQGDSFHVEVKGAAEVLQHAKAELHGETLELSVAAEHKHFFGIISITEDQSVQFCVTLPAVEAILVTGSGEAYADTLESRELELRVTGSGTLRVKKVAAEYLSSSITGSGDLLLGTVLAVRGEASITGSGDLSLESFAGESLVAEIRGSGDMVVGGRVGELSVKMMGSGDFVGRSLQADSANASIKGSGDIVLRRPGKESFSVTGSGDIALVD